MRGGYSSLYLRSRFNMDDPLGVREPNLVIESDDGFVVFLNGKEIFRRGLGDPGSEIPFDAVTGRKFEGWRPEEIAIAPEGLRAGENVLAIQQVNSSPADEKSFLRVRLRSLSSQETAIERAAAGLRAFREVVRPEDEETVLYCEARLLEAAEDFAAAADKYRRSLDLGATGAQPCLRLAACLRREGKLTEAEQVLRQALRSPSPLQQEDALWDSWLKCHFADLGTEHREVLALHRLLGRPAEKPTQHQEDISWLLQRLAAGEEIRINCGGKDCEAGGVVWSRDRFARGGDTAYFSRVDPQDRRVQAPLDQTARCFSSSAPLRPGYRIPLPNGDYELLLRFVEGSSEEKGHRRFDVLIEGAVAIPKYEPLAAVGFGVPDDVPAQARITDGDLEIDFRSLEGSPVISAMRIRRMDPAGR
jgi:tetratricopeptide (TPR) repeat protein